MTMRCWVDLERVNANQHFQFVVGGVVEEKGFSQLNRLLRENIIGKYENMT